MVVSGNEHALMGVHGMSIRRAVTGEHEAIGAEKLGRRTEAKILDSR